MSTWQTELRKKYQSVCCSKQKSPWLALSEFFRPNHLSVSDILIYRQHDWRPKYYSPILTYKAWCIINASHLPRQDYYYLLTLYYIHIPGHIAPKSYITHHANIIDNTHTHILFPWKIRNTKTKYQDKTKGFFVARSSKTADN